MVHGSTILVQQMVRQPFQSCKLLSMLPPACYTLDYVSITPSAQTLTLLDFVHDYSENALGSSKSFLPEGGGIVQAKPTYAIVRVQKSFPGESGRYFKCGLSSAWSYK